MRKALSIFLILGALVLVLERRARGQGSVSLSDAGVVGDWFSALSNNLSASASSAGRVFYVATNGSTSQGRIGNSLFPFAPDFSQTGFIFTNSQPGDKILILPGHYLITNVWINTGVTFEGVQAPKGSSVWFTSSTNISTALSLSTFQPGDNATIRNIFWEATNVWTSNSTLLQGFFASFAMGGYYFPTNVTIEGCHLFGGSDIFYASSFGNPWMILKDSLVESFWDFAKTTPGTLYSLNNTYVSHSWNNINNPTVNGSIDINMYDTGSRFYGFNGGELIGIKRVSGSEFYLGTNALGMAAWPNAASSGGYYYDDFLKATVSLGADGGTYLTNALVTNTVLNLGTNTMYVSGLTTVSAMNGAYTNKSVITSNSVSGPNGFFLVMGSGTWTNNTYTLTLNDPAATNLACTLGLAAPCDTVGIWGLKTNANGGYAYLADFGITAFPSAGVQSPWTLVSSLGSEGQWSQQTNSITTNITPLVYPAIFGGAIAFNTNATGSPLTNGYGVSFSTNTYFNTFLSTSNGVFFPSNNPALNVITNRFTNGGFWIGVLTNTLECLWMSNNVVNAKRLAP